MRTIGARSRLLPLAGAFLAATPAVLAGQQAGPLAGRYEFQTVSVEGDSLRGTVHVTGPAGAYGGRVLTTIRTDLRIDSVVADGPLVLVAAGGLQLRWPAAAADSFEGTWQLRGREGPLRGRRLPAAPDNSLPPVACRVSGLGEAVRCATLYVPEDRVDPSSRLIPLNIVILPARRTPAEGALYLFAGGPGQAATDQAGGNAGRFAGIRERRDIVMVDQRGTGGSNGLACEFESVEERAAALFGSFFPPAVARRCLGALAGRADPRFYHTAAAAEDVEAVRAWLGYRQLDLYGGSYGTRAALAYLRAHPGRIRTLTLRAVLAPSGTLTGDNPRSGQESLDRLFRDCAGDSACAAAFPRLAEDLNGLLARLDSAPPPVRIRNPAGGDSVTLSLTRGVFAGAVRRMLMDAGARQRLPLAIHQAARGSAETIRAGIEGTVAVAHTLAWGMGLSVVCAEDYPRLRGRDVAALTAGSFMGRSQVDGLLEICPLWPAGTPPAGYDRPVRSGVPALVLSGEWDPATPPRWGAEVASALPNALHVVMRGVSHAPFPDCAVAVMAELVERGTSEGLDLGCFDALRAAPFVLR